jgi:hypothetical protein
VRPRVSILRRESALSRPRYASLGEPNVATRPLLEALSESELRVLRYLPANLTGRARALGLLAPPARSVG